MSYGINTDRLIWRKRAQLVFPSLLRIAKKLYLQPGWNTDLFLKHIVVWVFQQSSSVQSQALIFKVTSYAKVYFLRVQQSAGTAMQVQ